MNIKKYTHKGVKIKDIRLKNNIENNDKYLALILNRILRLRSKISILHS